MPGRYELFVKAREVCPAMRKGDDERGVAAMNATLYSLRGEKVRSTAMHRPASPAFWTKASPVVGW